LPQLKAPVVVFSDAGDVAHKLISRLRGDAHDESWLMINASDHSGHSEESGRRALILWTAFAKAQIRVGSGISTFSKSAMLALKGVDDYVVDTRCYKGHRTDGDLFTCRRVSLRDLV
jgi:hypothetical protein